VSISDSGDYDPSITVTKSVTIAAAPGVTAAFSNAVTNGSIIDISPEPTFCRSTDCFMLILRNLTFDGQSVTQDAVRASGIRLLAEDCRFNRFRAAVYVNGAGTYQFTNCVFQNSETGIFLAPNPSDSPRTLMATVDGCRFEALSAVGIDAYPGLNNTAKVTVRNTLVNRAGTIGVRGSGAASGFVQLNVEGSEITNCATGVYSYSPNSVVRVSNSTIVANSTGILVQGGGQLLSRGNNTLEGNTTNGTFTGTFLAK
jgi:hypothetical protein